MKPAQAGESLLQTLYNLPSTHTGTPMHFGILLPLHNHLKNQQRVQGSWEKNHRAPEQLLCLQRPHSPALLSAPWSRENDLVGLRHLLPPSSPPLATRPSSGNQGTAAFQNHTAAAQAQSPGVFLTLLCPPRESWNAWEGP